MLSDAAGDTSIVHYFSNLCRRIFFSDMAADVHSLVLVFDYRYIVRHLLWELLGRAMEVEVYIDLRTLCNVLVKDVRITERLL